MSGRVLALGQRKLARFATSISVVLFLVSCSEPAGIRKMHEDIDLGQFIQLPFDYETIKVEIVTLPEPGDLQIPGPTDFVALVATISSSPERRDNYLVGLPDVGSTYTVPAQFWRPWLDPEQHRALQTIGAGSESARDVSQHLTKRAKRALAVPAGDSDLVLYLEFVSPW